MFSRFIDSQVTEKVSMGLGLHSVHQKPSVEAKVRGSEEGQYCPKPVPSEALLSMHSGLDLRAKKLSLVFLLQVKSPKTGAR
jgi:hypothetical protein